MIEWVKNFEFNTAIAVWLYWVPLAICVVGYALKNWRDYWKDIEAREAEHAAKVQKKHSPNDNRLSIPYYHPQLTVGRIIGRAIATACPVLNLCAAICDVGPTMFGKLFTYLGKTFDFPLVPPRRN